MRRIKYFNKAELKEKMVAFGLDPGNLSIRKLRELCKENSIKPSTATKGGVCKHFNKLELSNKLGEIGIETNGKKTDELRQLARENNIRTFRLVNEFDGAPPLKENVSKIIKEKKIRTQLNNDEMIQRLIKCGISVDKNISKINLVKICKENNIKPYLTKDEILSQFLY